MLGCSCNLIYHILVSPVDYVPHLLQARLAENFKRVGAQGEITKSFA